VCGCELAQGLFLAIGARRSQSSLKLPSRSRSLLSRRHLSAAVALADADNLDKPILRLFSFAAAARRCSPSTHVDFSTAEASSQPKSPTGGARGRLVRRGMR
jgi:hypothetical protein